ncbi:MAG: hypothetical protein DRP45_04075 [Candidatus Zixiibacteriota bacterium]|nr:MAG: hypothetical protein DRP45_04075 [candidate division Zixibacteria bacterium]
MHAYTRVLVAHEIGHTIGFRHNFKASTIYTPEQLSDPDFTRQHGTCGTIMDYIPVNLPFEGLTQGEFFASIPGPYSDWLIEYGYSDFGASSPEEELPMIDQIASRAGEPLLVFATDGDVVGRTMKSIDPLVNMHDLGNDPLAFAKETVRKSRVLWTDALAKLEKPGARYQDISRVFRLGWRGYSRVAQIAPKYVGGIDHLRSHIGDPNGRAPFKVIPASRQREAVALIKDLVFAADAFDLPAGLANKLQAENMDTFSRGPSQIDYPWHQRVLAVQNMALANLYGTYVLGRLVNNVNLFDADEEKYTIYDMFTEVRRAIWSEIVKPENVNSLRRQLQLLHLNRIIRIYLSTPAGYPSDARTLAANDLDILEKASRKAVNSGLLDGMTKAHFKEVILQIESAKKAQRTYSTR